eukprot:206143_1
MKFVMRFSHILLTFHIIINVSCAIQLFTDTMSTYDTTKWIQLVGDVSFGITSSTSCPTAPCTRLQTSQLGFASITSTTVDATNIANIRLQLDIQVRGLTKPKDRCTIQYSTDNGTTYNTLLKYTSINSSIVYYNIVANLTDAVNKSSVKLHILQEGIGENDRCFLSNIVLSGDISVPTTNPMETLLPTILPTDNLITLRPTNFAVNTSILQTPSITHTQHSSNIMNSSLTIISTNIQNKKFGTDIESIEHYWIYVNWTFSGLFVVISVYIFIEIHPFYIDKLLNWKQPSRLVMTV